MLSYNTESAMGRHAVRRSRTRESSTKEDTLDREGVLATLGYKPEKSWRPTAVAIEKSELCLRCGKKVYPVEKIDVGGLYHRACFKCKTCNIQLNLRNFHRDVDPLQKTITKEIYCKTHVPRSASGHVDTSALEIKRALDAQKQASSHVRGAGYEYQSHYNPDALEFRHHAKAAKRRKKVRRRSTLRSYKDFEKFGVYDAQTTLEELHRKEEDELYKQMSADRKRYVDKLERHIADEKKRTVAELITWFDKRGASEEEKIMGIKKIENFYRSQREERMQLLLRRLTVEEQAAVARMIEKHSQEMLILIQEKEREAEKAMRFEFRESQLLEDGTELLPSNEESEEDYSSEEEGNENEEETTEDATESFSEASYRVEQCESISGVIERDTEYRLSPAASDSVRGTDMNQAGDPRTQQVDDAFLRQGSRRSASRQHVNNKQSQDLAVNRQDQHAHRHAGVVNRTPDDQRYAPYDGSTGSYPEPGQIGVRSPDVQPLRERNRGLSLSEQLLHVNPPSEYLPWDSEENVLVKVHAAQDAHLVDDRLRSHHYCTSPSSGTRYYDLTKSPRSPRSGTGAAHRSGSVDSPRSRDQDRRGEATKANGRGRYMVFQRPEDLENTELSDDEQTRASSGFLRNKNGRSKDGRNKLKNGQHSQEHDANQRARSLSRDRLRDKNDQVLEGNQEKIRDLVESHALRAREALRALGLPAGADDLQPPEAGFFPDPSPIAPKVAPPKTKKSALFRNPSVFKEFDDNAIRETKREHKTFTDLVRQLSKHCESELQRVRSIFRWITAKDLNELHFSDNIESDTPMGLLRGIKLGVETYHNLFKRLCSYAGLHCEIIEGYSKGAGYKPGSRFHGNAFRNQWTAVCVDGAWRFVNCNWGARHVKGPRDERMTYKCDEFYFLTDPEEHVYQHLPDDPEWQLLPEPVSMDAFVALPLLKSPFFNRHLALAADYESVIHTSDGSVEVRLISPAWLGFVAELKSKDGRVKPEVLRDRVLVRRVNEEVIFLAKVPSVGKYFLEIYCGRHQDDGRSMDNVCAFRICCYDVTPNAHVSFPPGPAFGRTRLFGEFDIREETHSDPYVVHSGELLIALLCRPALRLSHSLKRWNHRDRKMEEHDRHAFVVHRSDHVVSFVVHCPRRGAYAFSLYASDERRPEPGCVYRYYIECTAPADNPHPLPKASRRWQHCRLIEPLTGDLPARTRVRFRIESAAAVELVVNASGSWLGLHRSGNLWQGHVNTGESRTTLAVYGRFDKNKEKYIPLLEYKVKESSGAEDEMKSLKKYI